jgi:AcrR family transcriptional regulator
MPRISPAREHAVRSRIIESALRVFAEKGYYGATIADVVHDSGLSVGAIYTYYRTKDDLFLATCDVSTGQGMGELANRLARGRSPADKLAIAMAFYLDSLVGKPGEPDMASCLMAQWSRAEAEPAVRASLARRRSQVETVGELLLREAIASGELPPWVDAAPLAGAMVLFLDGLLLWRIELGESYRRDLAERRIRALMQPLLAAASAPLDGAPEMALPAANPWSVLAAVGSDAAEPVPLRPVAARH